VKFGEVVLQPPELTAQPRRSINRDQVHKNQAYEEWGFVKFVPQCSQGTRAKAHVYYLLWALV
jgi:hypothetical protein